MSTSTRTTRLFHLRPPRRFQPMLAVAVLAGVSVLWIYPFVWTISASLKRPLEIFTSGLNLIPARWLLDNYRRAWSEAQFGRYLFNTIIVSTGTVALVLARCSLAGYVLGRYDFVGKRAVLVVLVGTLFIPTGYTIIPVVALASKLGMLNTLWGLVLTLGGSGHVAELLIFAGYFGRLPKELEEACILDGGGFLDVFGRVMLPLAGPAIATATVLTFLDSWNSFFVPLVFTFSRPELRTLSVGMLAFVGEHETDWSGMAAAATISLLPVVVLFLALQRHYIEGIGGALKS